MDGTVQDTTECFWRMRGRFLEKVTFRLKTGS